MIISYNKKLLNVKKATSFCDRLKGFMFYKDKINYGIVFHTKSIHTFCMWQMIDVVLTNKSNQVLYYYPSLKCNRIILPKKNVYYIYELPLNYYNIKVGDYLKIEEP